MLTISQSTIIYRHIYVVLVFPNKVKIVAVFSMFSATLTLTKHDANLASDLRLDQDDSMAIPRKSVTYFPGWLPSLLIFTCPQ